MNILRKAFKIFNGSSWDEYHLKTDSKQVVHTKADGTDTTVEEQLLALNSTLKWTDWAALGSANELGISMRYRYNAFEVELQYFGNLQNKKISGGSDGYVFPALPDGLNPKYNIEHQIYACAGDNKGNLTLQCFPTGNAKKFTITSHNNVTVTPEYICGYVRYTRQ